MNYVRVLSFTLMAVSFAPPIGAATATWDPNPEADVTGYRLSYGTQTGVRDVSIDVGNVTTYQFSPPPGSRYYVVVQAYNSSGEIGPESAEVTFDVAATQNLPPVLTQPANQTSPRNTMQTLQLVAYDPEGAPLTFGAYYLPPGLVLNPSTGLIAGMPTNVGTYTFALIASDGALAAVSVMTWTVTDGGANRPPTLDQPANQTSGEGSAVSLALSGSDPDGNPLTYTATGLPGGLAVNATSGLISGTLSADSIGVYTVVATVSDGALTASQSFAWWVDGSDQPIRGDFDGDGRIDPATYRAANGDWRFWLSTSNFVVSGPVRWGASTDIPVAADYDGDRRTDIAFYRPSTGRWYVLLSSTNMQTTLDIQWGDANDRPMPMDYDNDGKADLALPRFGGFEILLSSSNYTTSVTVR